jgi:hypothetical protein
MDSITVTASLPDSSSETQSALEKEIYEDVYGTSEVSSFVEAEEMLEKARRQLEEALDLIPNEEKTDYMEAVKHAPHLVEIESSPVRFIRCALYNHTTAAQLLVAYWRKRREIFGDRSLLPMIQTGEGALAPEDVAVLNSGFGVLLPSDAHNRIVVFHDRSRLADPSMHSLQKTLRCLFYLLSVASECEESRAYGVVALEDHGEASANSFDGISVKQALELIQGKVMPIRVKAVHLVMKNQESASNVIPATLQVLEKSSFLRQRTVVHRGKTGKALFNALVKYGFRKDGLPLSLGGSWLYEERFTQWQAQRAQVEREGYYTARGRDIASMPLDELLQKAVEARQAEKIKRRRVMDSLYARRKRERWKIEMEVTEDQAKRLVAQNSDLRRKNGILQDLMQQAQQIVAQHTMVCDPQNDSKPAAQFPYSSFSETARVDHFAPMATHNLVAERARRQQQNVAKQDYAATDPSYETKPAFKSPRSDWSSLSADFAKGASSRPAALQNFGAAEPSYAFHSAGLSICPSLSSPWSAESAYTSSRPAALHNSLERAESAEHAQQAFERALCDRATDQAIQQELLADKLKKEIQCNDDMLRQEQNQRQRGHLETGERGEREILRHSQTFQEGERRQENLQQHNQALREHMLRQVNQILEADISRQNQLLRDGEVRHQNQLSRERELEQENKLLRESVIASTHRAKSAENAQRQVASVSQALHQLHQEEQQVLHEQQHQQQQRMHLQQQGEQHQQEKQQQKEVHQLQQQRQQQLVKQTQEDQQQHHQQQQEQQQQQHQQHQAQQQQHQHQERAQEQQSLSDMISWLKGLIQAGQQGQPGPNQQPQRPK